MGSLEDKQKAVIGGYRIIIVLLAITYILLWRSRETDITQDRYKHRIERLNLYRKLDKLKVTNDSLILIDSLRKEHCAGIVNVTLKK